MPSTRSVGVSLARRFNAGISGLAGFVAWRRLIRTNFRRRYATRKTSLAFPALKDRAKLISTLRAEQSSSKPPEGCATNELRVTRWKAGSVPLSHRRIVSGT